MSEEKETEAEEKSSKFQSRKFSCLGSLGCDYFCCCCRCYYLLHKKHFGSKDCD